jgi:hypothetical protein
MAVLTAQPIYKQYQRDAITNRTETPGTGNIVGVTGTVVAADGSTNTATPGKTTGIKTMQPGSQPSGSNVGTTTLSQKIVQQANNTVANTVTVSAGYKVAQIGASKAADKAGSNSLQNDTSAMALSSGVYPHSVPTPATGATAADGLSQGPEHE